MLKNLSVLKKLIVGIFLTAVILVAGAVLIYSFNLKVEELSLEMDEEYLVRIEIGKHISSDVNSFYRDLSVYNQTGNKFLLEDARVNLKNMLGEISELNVLTTAHSELEDLKQLTEEITTDVHHFEELLEEAENAMDHRAHAEKDIILKGEEISEILSELIHEHEAELDRLLKEEEININLIIAEADLMSEIEEISFEFSSVFEHVFEAQLHDDYSSIEVEKSRLKHIVQMLEHVMENTNNVQDSTKLLTIIDDTKIFENDINELIDSNSILHQLSSDLDADALELLEDASIILEDGIEDSKKGSKDIRRYVKTVSRLLIIGISSSLLISTIVNISIARGISKPLSEIVKINNGMGELNFGMDTTHINNLSIRKDEVGLLAHSSVAMIETIRTILNELDSSAIQLTESASASMSESQNLSALAEEEDASISELSDTVEEITKSITMMAGDVSDLAVSIGKSYDNAKLSLEKSETTKTETNFGRNQIKDIENEMDIIVTDMNSLKDSVLNLISSSEEIKEITNMINSIANQTNLLALNAAIEAARAGEAGKGFAVVADEIRKLAEDSTSSTSKISEIITDMEGIISRTSERSDSAKASVDQTNISVHEISNSFDKILNAVEESGELTSEILTYMDDMNDKGQNAAGATEEQAAATQQVTATIETIGVMSKSVSDSGIEMASTAENVQTVAEQVKEIIDRFDL